MNLSLEDARFSGVYHSPLGKLLPKFRRENLMSYSAVYRSESSRSRTCRPGP